MFWHTVHMYLCRSTAHLCENLGLNVFVPPSYAQAIDALNTRSLRICLFASGLFSSFFSSLERLNAFLPFYDWMSSRYPCSTKYDGEITFFCLQLYFDHTLSLCISRTNAISLMVFHLFQHFQTFILFLCSNSNTIYHQVRTRWYCNWNFMQLRYERGTRCTSAQNRDEDIFCSLDYATTDCSQIQ